MSTAKRETNLNWNEGCIGNQIGEAYLTEKFNEDHPLVEDAYRRIAKRHEILYDQIPVPVIWTDIDPYESAEQMFERIEEDEELLVYSGGSTPRYLSYEENIKGRAVHDYFGHYRHRVDFSIRGEFMKWYHVRHYYTGGDPDPHDRVRRVLFAEIVAQRCAAGYLPKGFGDPDFKQRAIVAPTSWIDLCKRAFL